MENIEKTIKYLESTKEEIGKHLDESFSWCAESIDNAIQTIGELQSNQCHLDSPCEYQYEDIKVEEVCEWERGSSGYVGYHAYYSKCCTTNSNGLEMQAHIIKAWKYCPYCGRKIKVAE